MWHVHNSASSGGEDGDVWGWCLWGLEARKVGGWLAVLFRGGQSKEVKGTDEGKGRAWVWVWVVAKEQEDLTYPQLRSDFISMKRAQQQEEMGRWRGLDFLKHVYEKDMMVN